MEFDKTKIYTAINADELKVGDKVYVADSLEQLRRRVECNDTTDFFGFLELVYGEDKVYRFELKGHDYALAYLVEKAKEEEWRPFKDIQGLIDAWKIKTGVMARANTMPLIWLRGKNTGYIRHIEGFNKDSAATAVYIGGVWHTMLELFMCHTFLDGSPCGKKCEVTE